MRLAVDVAQRVADVARADHVFVLVGAFVVERKNHADGQGRQVSVDLEDEVLRFPEAAKERHEDLASVLRHVACESKFLSTKLSKGNQSTHWDSAPPW